MFVIGIQVFPSSFDAVLALRYGEPNQNRVIDLSRWVVRVIEGQKESCGMEREGQTRWLGNAITSGELEGQRFSEAKGIREGIGWDII